MGTWQKKRGKRTKEKRRFVRNLPSCLDGFFPPSDEGNEKEGNCLPRFSSRSLNSFCLHE